MDPVFIGTGKNTRHLIVTTSLIEVLSFSTWYSGCSSRGGTHFGLQFYLLLYVDLLLHNPLDEYQIRLAVDKVRLNTATATSVGG